MYDIIIIGAGPAGLSAAITARARNKSVLIISNAAENSGLYKAARVDNYPGFPEISGRELSDRLSAHAAAAGAELITARVTAAVASEKSVSASYGSEYAEGKTLILAPGTVQGELFPGEAELLGRGVSYCATCDGMLYRRRRVVVAAYTAEAAEEAEFLRSIGCEVTETSSKDIQINGADKVKSVSVDGALIECDAVFVLRATIAPASVISGLAVADGVIVTARDGSTNIPRVFAAGDCAGAPRQIAKAVGEGQTAALSAVKLIDGEAG